MVPLPAYVNPEAWAGFVEMRRKIKAPLTVRAATLILFELQRIKDAGHDPNASLDQSTMKCWRDVWPLKDKPIQRVASAGTGALREMNEKSNALLVGPSPEVKARIQGLLKRVV